MSTRHHVVNGSEIPLTEALTVSRLLIEQKVRMPAMVSVELNGENVKQTEYDSTVLGDGDRVEFLYFMGGGNGSD